MLSWLIVLCLLAIALYPAARPMVVAVASALKAVAFPRRPERFPFRATVGAKAPVCPETSTSAAMRRWRDAPVCAPVTAAGVVLNLTVVAVEGPARTSI